MAASCRFRLTVSRPLRRLAALIAAVLTICFALALSAEAVVSPANVAHAYAYDSPHCSAWLTDSASERGPPAYDRGTINDAVDLGSHGASVRPDDTAPGATTTYDNPATLSHDAQVATTTGRDVQVADGDLCALSGASVAANAGPKALNAASRVSPWAGSSLSRLTREGEVMYRVWGGGADKAGSWLTPINPISSTAARQGLALPAENAALYVSKVTLPAGVRVQVGTAGPAFGQPGGWAQMQLLERIPLSSFGKGVPLQ